MNESNIKRIELKDIKDINLNEPSDEKASSINIKENIDKNNVDKKKMIKQIIY